MRCAHDVDGTCCVHTRFPRQLAVADAERRGLNASEVAKNEFFVMAHRRDANVFSHWCAREGCLSAFGALTVAQNGLEVGRMPGGRNGVVELSTCQLLQRQGAVCGASLYHARLARPPHVPEIKQNREPK